MGGHTGYHAPEIVSNIPFSAQAADIFALGVILFILRARHPPFNLASPKEDRHYKLIFANRMDLFWQVHSKDGEDLFSPELKELITFMLQYRPEQRLNITDLAGHPWVHGPVATKAQIREDLSARKH